MQRQSSRFSALLRWDTESPERRSAKASTPACFRNAAAKYWRDGVEVDPVGIGAPSLTKEVATREADTGISGKQSMVLVCDISAPPPNFDFDAP
jgi:hypothetical protein